MHPTFRTFQDSFPHAASVHASGMEHATEACLSVLINYAAGIPNSKQIFAVGRLERKAPPSQPGAAPPGPCSLVFGEACPGARCRESESGLSCNPHLASKTKGAQANSRILTTVSVDLESTDLTSSTVCRRLQGSFLWTTEQLLQRRQQLRVAS